MLNNNYKVQLSSWAKDHASHFLLSQLTHTAITVAVVAALFFGAARVGALDSVLAPTTATADSSFTTINYQGRLGDAAGNPVDTTGAHDGLSMTFALYDADTGGTALWSETHANVPVSEGLFSVKLGSVNALSTELLNGDRWLGIQIGNDPEMAPREKLAAVPYAMVAGTALSVSSLDAPDGSPTDALVVDEDGNVGIGTTNPQNRLHIVGGSIDIGEARNAGSSHSSQAGLNLGKEYNTNIQLAVKTFGASHGILFNAYKKSSQVNGSLFATGNTAYVHDVGNYRGGAGAVGFIANGGRMSFYISPESTGQDTDIEWGEPKMSIFRSGNVEIAGDFTASGTKSAVVETESYGERKLYAFEQATNRFADEGRGTLVAGTARVTLDPVFLETVENDFLIHLTPYGHATLYVAEVGADYFVVEAQEAGAEVNFAWLLTATRKGYEDVRLEPAEE
jgi:hypothetical protein